MLKKEKSAKKYLKKKIIQQCFEKKNQLYKLHINRRFYNTQESQKEINTVLEIATETFLFKTSGKDCG